MKDIKTVIYNVIFTAVGIFCLVFGLIPLVAFGYFHIGAQTLLIFAALFLTYFLWGTHYRKAMKKHRLLKALTVSAGILFIWFNMMMMNAAYWAPPSYSGENTVIILGCGLNGETPSLTLANRLDVATEYLKANETAKCIVSGGQGPGETITEAEAMKRYLINRGISEERIFMEDRSTNTKENLEFSMSLLKNEGLSREVIIVTDSFHQYRAKLLLEKIDSSVFPKSISSTCPLGLLPSYYIRDLGGAVLVTLNIV